MVGYRKSIRLDGYNYASVGAYFVTVCTQNRLCLFGDVVDGAMVLNDAGQMIEYVLGNLRQRFEKIDIDTHVIMPNHFHVVIIVKENRRRGESCIRPELGLDKGDHKDRPYYELDDRIDENRGQYKHPCGTEDGSLGLIIQAFKSITTVEYIRGVKQQGWSPFPGRLWQRNYYEHIIRNDDELNRIREYILNNPMNWDEDEYNPNRSSKCL
jgi:REP element-mobilizing transposase RayT